MFYPNLKQEKTLFSRGKLRISGLDEAGRGAWAGPIVAGAIIIKPDHLPIDKKIKKIVKDSKLLRPETRELAFKYLVANFDWAIGAVSSSDIDRLGISAANQLAMELAIESLNEPPDFLLVDGRGFKFNIDYLNIIDGDFKIFSIAAASIIAKVSRDRMLRALDKDFPSYGFGQNKGYGTLRHHQSICKYGLCPCHRRTFRPMKDMI